MLHREFIFERAPFPTAHASTIAETSDGLVAAWFGGTREGAADVNIWVSRRVHDRWSEPHLVATGESRLFRRCPCWNPVLFQVPDGPLLLFYKVGPSPSRWWGMVKSSTDGGRTFGAGERLPDGILGPIKNKPVFLDDGTLICPSSIEHDGWRVVIERSADLGRTWERTRPLNDRRQFAAIQPTVLRHPGGRLQILCRTRQGAITECWSEDDGKQWSTMRPTALPNPDSGIDAAMTADGRIVLVYNHAQSGRTPLNLAVSEDGIHWHAACVLEDDPGEFSYPAVIISADGRAHVTYTWNRRRIRYACIDPAAFAPVPIRDGVWPQEVRMP